MADLPLFAGVPVYILIVGRQIYKAAQPDAAVHEIRQVIEQTLGK